MFPSVTQNDAYELNSEEYKNLQLRLLKRRRWELREHFHPFELNEESFQDAYRLNKTQVKLLISKLADTSLLRKNKTIAGITIETQVLITLSFYSRGCYQYCVSQNWYHPVETSTACIIIDKVTDALVTLAEEFIVFPKTQQQRRKVHQGFLEKFPVPGILAIIDGTAIRVIRPNENEEAFYSYKGYHALNVQMVNECVNIVPGSNNDQFLWNSSEIKCYIEHLRKNVDVLEDEGKFYVIGDSGYSHSPVLLIRDTTVDHTEDSPEGRYTKAISVLRSTVERTFGQEKGMFRCILKERQLHYQPFKASKIVIACAVLYNFYKLNGIPMFENVEYDYNSQKIDENIQFDATRGLEETEQIIFDYFA